MLKQVHLYMLEIGKKHLPELYESYDGYSSFSLTEPGSRGLRNLASWLESIVHVHLDRDCRQLSVHNYGPEYLRDFFKTKPLTAAQKKEFERYLAKAFKIDWVEEPKTV